jgi:hypothetical protein
MWPVFLGPNAPTPPKRLTRLDLANWLVSGRHPLTARVFVNRLWKQFFGVGLSKQLDELGTQGDWPAHPEVLDWLAVEFVESGWNIKHVIKLILQSATYRQSALPPPAAASQARLASIDPENRLLSRQNRYRLDAELVRDQALAVLFPGCWWRESGVSAPSPISRRVTMRS